MDQDKEKNKQKIVQKYNLNEVEDIWSSLLSDESSDLDGEQFEGESLLYGDSYSDPSPGNEQDFYSVDEQYEDENLFYDENGTEDVFEDNQELDTVDEQSENDNLSDENLSGSATGDEQIPDEHVQVPPGADEYSAVLEFVGGTRQEVARARLFQPQENTILLIDWETNDELIITFDQLACIQISGFPAGTSHKQKESSVKEIIETVDGNTYHVLVSSKQDIDSLLCCFSIEEQTPFPVTLFPKANIRKRCQDKLLSDILLEKRFISRTILQKALQEFEQIKSMTFEKIIAQKARVPLAEIEVAINNAKQNQLLGLQPGEILLISGLVNEEQILEALDYHEHINNLEIGQFLIDKGIVKEVEVYICLAEKHRIPFVDLRQRKISKEFFALLPVSMILRYEILPLVKKNDILLIATHVVDMTHLSESIAKAADCKQVKYVLSPPAHIRKIIHLLHAKSE